jgi:predicted outer membrane repeat protein
MLSFRHQYQEDMTMSNKSRRTIRLTLSAFILWLLSASSPAKTIYVDDDAAGANDGSSWANAYIYLQDALADANAAEKPLEIRVAQGIYRPNEGLVAIPEFDWRTTTFQLINGVTLRGGYAGFGVPQPDERDVSTCETILSGDLSGDDVEVADPRDLPDEPTRTDNSYHVVTSNGTDANTILDGFTITGGNANGTEPHDHGGGLCIPQSDLTLVNCSFYRNTATSAGGAIFNSGGRPSLGSCMFKCNHASGGGAIAYGGVNLKLANCIFRNNSSLYWGGALESYGQSLELVDCMFINNSAGQSGGAFNNSGASTTLVGCRFTGNRSGGGGGAIVNQGCNTKLANCLFIGNSAKSRGGAIHSRVRTDLNLTNCTFHRNSSVVGGGSFCNSYSNATIRNCIMLDNSARNGTEISLNATDYPSNASVAYSNIKDGESAVHVEDGCTLVWSDSNINEDPLFANLGYWADANDPNIVVEPNDPNAVWVDGDYHLKSQMGRWDPNSASWVRDDMTGPCIDAGDPNSDWSSETWPHGERINMGAYGGTPEASMSTQPEAMSLPSVAYIHERNVEAAESFQSLLSSYGCSTTLIRLEEVAAVPLDSYDLIIVANDTQYEDAWSDPNTVAAIEDSGKPVVGLGDGGYDFFGLLGLSVGYPHGGHGSRNSIEVVDPNSALYRTPYSIEIPADGALRLYTETNHVGLYLWPTIPETVTVLGREVNDVCYYPLATEYNRYLLWGFTESPQKMTEVGKRLFINVVVRAANAAWESQIY